MALNEKKTENYPGQLLSSATWAVLQVGSGGKLKTSSVKTGTYTSGNHAESKFHGIPVLLRDAGAAVPTPEGLRLHASAAQLRMIAVAVPGSWMRDDHAFSITANDLNLMVRNFEKKKNDMIVIDYEHASEMPEVAKGGPVPAAGWIHKLHVSGSRFQEAGKKIGTTSVIPATLLFALVEWTPQAEQMIASGQYRFFSPAIDWGATDKQTGEMQGATLTSGALTNHPFLEELPPIMLSDGEIISAGPGPANETGALDLPCHEGAKNMKKLSLKPIPEGDEQGGDHAVFEEGSDAPVGFVPHSDLLAYTAKHLGANPDQEEDNGENRAIAEQDEHTKMTAREAYKRSIFLREAVHKGKIDGRRAAELARTGKVTLAEYIRAQEAEKLVESAITSGKILPRDRAFFFQDAIDRPKEFQEYLRNAAPVVRLGVKGLGSSESLPLDEEIHLGVKQLMNEKGLDYAKALKEFLSANPVLGEQYRRKHTLPSSLETRCENRVSS